MFGKEITKINLSLIAIMMILAGFGFTNQVIANEEIIEESTIKQREVETNKYNLLLKSPRLIAIEAVK